MLAHEMSQKDLDLKAKQTSESSNCGSDTTVSRSDKMVHIHKDLVLTKCWGML